MEGVGGGEIKINSFFLNLMAVSKGIGIDTSLKAFSRGRRLDEGEINKCLLYSPHPCPLHQERASLSAITHCILIVKSCVDSYAAREDFKV